MDRETWCPAIHGVKKSRTWLSDWTELKDERWEREERGGGEGDEIQRQRERTAEVISDDITIENFKKKYMKAYESPTLSKAAENKMEKGKSGIITDLFNTKGGKIRRQKGT